MERERVHDLRDVGQQAGPLVEQGDPHAERGEHAGVLEPDHAGAITARVRGRRSSVTVSALVRMRRQGLGGDGARGDADAADGLGALADGTRLPSLAAWMAARCPPGPGADRDQVVVEAVAAGRWVGHRGSEARHSAADRATALRPR
jgi:hypothetical protein